MNAKLGMLLKIMSALCATLMLACVKGLNSAIPTGEVIFSVHLSHYSRCYCG